MEEIEGILARHSECPYVRGQLNLYIFLYFPIKNLGPVVQSWISANTGLKFNPLF
jgi:hypothetical protein